MTHVSIKAIEYLQKEISDEIRRRQDIKKNIYILLSLNTLKAVNQRLDKIKKILKNSKYNILFVGQVGVGKTTAICHLFNLIYGKDKKNNQNKKITVIEEILSTGSGKTTICETIIKPAQKTFIEIEPYSPEDIIQFIEEFCTYIWQKVHPETDSEYSPELPPAELMRAIRNIVALKESYHTKVLTDQAVELANKFNESEFNYFKDEVLNRANIAKRTETKIKFTNNKISYQTSKSNYIDLEKKWIKDTFNDINLAKINDFSIPKKVYIYISPNITDFNRYPKFNAVIDTKGMDVVRNREDLEQYIRDNDQTICIFTENFKAAPSNVSDLIERYLTPESKDIDTKFALLVLPQKGEPDNVIASDGKVESRDEGIAIRKSQIQTEFNKQNIKFISDNILFYDSLQYYLTDGRIDPDFEEYDIEDEKQSLINEISNIIMRRENKLINEFKSLKKIFLQIKKENNLDPEDEKILQDLKKKIQEQGILKSFKHNLMYKYLHSLKDYHVMVFRATNNRFGIYDLRDVNIYFKCKDVTEDLVKDNLKKAKSQILGAVELAEQHVHDKLNLAPILKIIQTQIDKYYEEIVIAVGEEISNMLENEKLFPQKDTNPFWSKAQNRWGKGSGYKNDVLAMYKNEIQDVDSLFLNKIQDLWQTHFLDKILSYFSDHSF